MLFHGFLKLGCKCAAGSSKLGQLVDSGLYGGLAEWINHFVELKDAPLDGALPNTEEGSRGERKPRTSCNTRAAVTRAFWQCMVDEKGESWES